MLPKCRVLDTRRAVVALYNESRLARTRQRRPVIAQDRQRKRERETEKRNDIGDIPENGETKIADKPARAREVGRR